MKNNNINQRSRLQNTTKLNDQYQINRPKQTANNWLVAYVFTRKFMHDFDLLTFKCNQLIFVLNCTKVVDIVKFL